MSTSDSVPIGLEFGDLQPPADDSHPRQRNVVQFATYPPPAGQLRESGLDAGYQTSLESRRTPYRPVHARAPHASDQAWIYGDPHAAWPTAEDPLPQADCRQHALLDEPLEPLSDRLDRLAGPSGPAGLQLIQSDLLDRYAEAEAEQTEEAETDWYASRIAGARSWASMENSLDSLIADFEKRHHQANIYVAGGIGGAVVLTLIALSAILTLS